MIVEAIKKAAEGIDLTAEEARGVMDEIMRGEASDAQKGAYLTALHAKGESIDEITGSALGMRAHMLVFETGEPTMEIVGTGGDRSSSFNISTVSAIVLASLGVKTTKHGNRAASSKCGTADCLEALGVNIAAEPEQMKETLKETDFAFLFAQKYHAAMRYVGGVRKEIGIPTIFNILGPLANPAKAQMQLFGVYKEELVEPLTRVLMNLGVKAGMTVYGQDCLDEISMSAPTTVCEIAGDTTKTYEITPEQFGFDRCDKSDLVGGTPEENAQIVRSILDGTERGAKLQAVLLNAGAAMHVARGVSIEEGIAMAAQAIETGRAKETLEKIVAVSNGRR